MTKERLKFLYAYLDDMETNPKIIFELHRSALPEDSRPFITKTLENLDKDTTFLNLDAIDKIGFFTVLTVLHERKIKRGRHDAAIVFALEDSGRFAIDVDSHAFASLKEKGEYYGFLPLKPFFPDLKLDENVFDDVLSMRVGRLVVQALLD